MGGQILISVSVTNLRISGLGSRISVQIGVFPRLQLFFWQRDQPVRSDLARFFCSSRTRPEQAGGIHAPLGKPLDNQYPAHGSWPHIAQPAGLTTRNWLEDLCLDPFIHEAKNLQIYCNEQSLDSLEQKHGSFHSYSLIAGTAAECF